jgi:hypothetical protein
VCVSADPVAKPAARKAAVLDLDSSSSFTVSSFLAGNFTSEERLAMLGEALLQAGLPER